MERHLGALGGRGRGGGVVTVTVAGYGAGRGGGVVTVTVAGYGRGRDGVVVTVAGSSRC